MRLKEEDLPMYLDGRIVKPEDLELLRFLIADNPSANHDHLANEVCRAWSWTKPNGAPKVLSAKRILLTLHKSGLIQLPRTKPLGKQTREPKPETSGTEAGDIIRHKSAKGKNYRRVKEDDFPLRLAARMVTCEDLDFIRSLIAQNPGSSRKQLFLNLCRTWSWNKPNGTPKELSAKNLLLTLEKSGLIQLPPVRHIRNNGVKPLRTPAGEPKPPMNVALSELGPLKMRLVTTQADHNLWRELIDRYHYLGYNWVAGATLFYIVDSPQGVVALFRFSAAAWHVKDRDRWIGWNEEHRLQFRHLVVNNSRFLIVPWIKCKNLATKVLSMVIHRLPTDWQEVYNYTPVLLETYVDQGRFWGTSYKAANWKLVGLTQGRGRNGSMKTKLPLKSVYLYPLVKDCRRILTGKKKPKLTP